MFLYPPPKFTCYWERPWRGGEDWSKWGEQGPRREIRALRRRVGEPPRPARRSGLPGHRGLGSRQRDLGLPGSPPPQLWGGVSVAHTAQSAVLRQDGHDGQSEGSSQPRARLRLRGPRARSAVPARTAWGGGEGPPLLAASRGSTWLPLTARSGPSQLGGSDLVRSRACQRLNPTPPVARFPGLSFPLPPVPLLPIWAAPGLLHGFRGTEALPTAGASAPLPPRGPGWGGCAQCAVRPLSLANGRHPAPAAPTGAREAGDPPPRGRV